jgi:EAL domain
MGMDVVAEGIETLGQLSELRRLNCRYGQGYLFARPLDALAATQWISHPPQLQADLFSHREDFVPARPAMMQLRAAWLRADSCLHR